MLILKLNNMKKLLNISALVCLSHLFSQIQLEQFATNLPNLTDITHAGDSR